jgi:hypothetical protein
MTLRGASVDERLHGFEVEGRSIRQYIVVVDNYFWSKIMHFRIRNKAIQLIRTTYDPVRKRGIATVVGSVPRRSPELPENVAAALTADEISEYETFQASQASIAVLEAKLAAHSFPATVQKIIAYIDETTDSKERDLLVGYLQAASLNLRRFSRRSEA